jgi:hypothetical protein
MKYISTTVLIILILITTSGCIGEKTVIKASIVITGEETNPHIEDIKVTTETISKIEDYSQVTPHFPGVNMHCICDMGQIDYWRSVDYHGPGEYEIISELIKIPQKGESVDVIILVVDENSDQLTKKTKTIIWE